MLKDAWNNNWIRLAALDMNSGQGRTYLACRVNAPDRTATHVLKELKHQKDKERRGRMHSEVASLERLDHPGVARFADSNSARWNDDEELFLVTEFIPGKNLRDFVGRTPIPFHAALQVAHKLLDTLQYCHDKGIVHRDIKPENIVLRNDEPRDPVLIDFGLAYDDESRPEDFATPTGQQLGNRFYSLPEYRVAGADKRDAISDLTLVVAILFYMLTGVDPEVPLDDMNQPPHKRRVAAEALRRLSEPQQSALTRLFDIGFASERIKRWTSIETLRREVANVLSASSDIAPKMSFDQQLKAVQTEFSETPAFVISKQIAALGKLFEDLSNDVHRQVLASTSADFQSSQSGFLHGVPDGTRFARAFTIVSKYDSNVNMKIMMYARAQGGEFAILAVDNGVSREIARVGLFDPEAPIVIREAIEQYYLLRLRAMIH